jgi:vacuolar-type H+-ATPase subunit E/Vma4
LSSIINIIGKEKLEALSNIDQAYRGSMDIIEGELIRAKEESALIRERVNADKRRFRESRMSDAEIKGRARILALLDTNLELLISDTVSEVLTKDSETYRKFLGSLIRDAMKNYKDNYIIRAGKEDRKLLGSLVGKAGLAEASFNRGFMIEDKEGNISIDYSLDEYVAGKKQSLKRAIVDSYFSKVI